jgi:hypothetical protein
MRRHGTIAVLCLALLALLYAGVFVTVAFAEPLSSSDRLFGVQDFAERARSNFLLDPTARAEYDLQLL